jgi:hypothetical protein
LTSIDWNLGKSVNTILKLQTDLLEGARAWAAADYVDDWDTVIPWRKPLKQTHAIVASDYRAVSVVLHAGAV